MKKIYFFLVFVMISFFLSCNFTHPSTPFELSTDYVAPALITNLVIDTFEDSNWDDNLYGLWLPVNDAQRGGNSTIQLTIVDAEPSEGFYSARADYTLGHDFQYRFVEAKDQYPHYHPQDFSDFSNIYFDVRGSGKKLTFVIETTNIHDYAYYDYTISSTPSTWTTYTLNIRNDLTQPGWGDSKPFMLEAVEGIDFKASSQIDGETGWFEFDNIHFEK